MNEFFKSIGKQYGPTAVLLLLSVTGPLLWGVHKYEPARQTGGLDTAPQASAPAPVVDLATLMELMARKQAAPLPEWEPIPRRNATPPAPLQTALQPVPDPLIMALEKQNAAMSEMMERFMELENRFNTVLRTTAGPGVDRNGNTAAALDDIHADVNPPELPDPLVKSLAKYPGARVVADPDTGEYIPAVTEWRETNWGGGKQLHLLRHKGKVYGQTVLHKSREKTKETAPPQPPPFRISN